jgi:hypothetical protein
MKEKPMKTKLRVVFTALPKDVTGWPHINYDVETRAAEVMPILRDALPEIEFDHVVYTTAEEAEHGYGKNEKGKYDGWLIYVSALWTGIPQFYAQHVKPVVIADELYSGSGEFLDTMALIESKKLPVGTIASSNIDDLINSVKLLDVMHKMRKSRVLIFSNSDDPWGSTSEKMKATKEIFGTEVILKPGKELNDVYLNISDNDAIPIRDQWINEAKAVIEPDKKEILKSAKLYLAIKQLMKETQANAVSVDCLNLFNAGAIDAYPCLSFFKLNNDGETGVCEGDLNSTLCQLLFRFLCNKPAFVSDPVIDEAAGQIIYAHCVATNRPHGSTSIGCPYIIRSHAEDRNGASVQSILPLGQTVTTIAISSIDNVMGLHTARTVANVDEERACRTKLAAEVDTEKLLKNYHMEYFNWHQTTCYGNYRRAMKQLSRLYGMECIEQDR